MDNDKDIWTDPADSPLSKYEQDFAGQIDSVTDLLTEAIDSAFHERGVTSAGLAQAVVKHVKPIAQEGTNRDEVGIYAAELLRFIVTADNPKMEALCWSMAAGLPDVIHLTREQAATIAGVSKQALNKRLLAIADGKQVAKGRTMKSKEVREKYHEIQTNRGKKCSLKLYE